MPVGIGIGVSITLLKPVTSAGGASTAGEAIGLLLLLTKAS